MYLHSIGNINYVSYSAPVPVIWNFVSKQIFNPIER